MQPACELVGLSVRALQRWKAEGVPEDRRAGPKTAPANKLSSSERAQVLTIVNQPEYRDLSPAQIVPLLADQGIYVASESTIYRILRQEGQAAHRAAARPARHQAPQEFVATGPNQVWSWDITYLRAPIAGRYFYLYLVMDVWSRKIVGTAVHEEESAEHASVLIRKACAAEGVDGTGLVLHSDNGGPMKGSTMLATLQRLGIVASFSRPRVSDDNPYVEALFRTAKYRPTYPTRPFESVDHAENWVAEFVDWYNEAHFHSAIRFVTPSQRHAGEDIEILERRDGVYERARAKNPQRWSGPTRDWSRIKSVRLNPAKGRVTAVSEAA